MKSKHIISLFFLLLGSQLSHAADCGKAISADAVVKLPEKVTLGDLSAKFGKACPGDGPISWYQSGADRQIWFYWKKSAQPGTASNLVLMASEVNAKDFDEQKIIWPKELIGKDAPTTMLNEFGPKK